MADSEDKSTIDEELEDGEIEDDEDENDTPTKNVDNEIKEAIDLSSKVVEKKVSENHQLQGGSSSKKSNRKDKTLQNEDDDFMSNIEAQIANVLKKDGVEPPMPTTIRKQELDQENDNDRKVGRSAGTRKRRRRKEKDHKKESTSSKKRSKLADNDNLYMVGGTLSPDQQHQNSNSESDGDTTYSSYESDDYRRTSYDDRRNKRRDKYGSSRSERSERGDRNRDRRDRHNRDSEKEVCLRFSEFGHCPDDNCPRTHEVRQPKKMELCKFWLMDCCAKKDKCSYMHGDFPCKFYYLGLKCVNKDCKFMHGKPLSDNLKQILLKHLDTAPKEILGDFPRIGRDNASKMIAQTHIKLCEEFNFPLPESDKKVAEKIPSLLEMKVKPPDNFHENNRKDSNRNSRWLNKDSTSVLRNSPIRNLSPNTSSSISTSLTGPGDVLLSEMKNILSEKQITSMSQIGVKTVNHINNLTVAQLNDLGLSLATIGEIQATAINMDNKKINTLDEQPIEITSSSSSKGNEGVSEDVDMRIFSSDTIMSPNQSEISDNCKKPLNSPPIDYSQYLKDSNLNNDDEDELGLKIDESYGSDIENCEKKDSQSEDEQLTLDVQEKASSSSILLLPPSIDTSAFLKAMPAKVDLSSSIQQLMEKETRDPRSRDPRASKQKSPLSHQKDKIPEISSPTYRDPRQLPKAETPRHTSIYEIDSPSEDDEEIQIKLSKDKDMRLPAFLRDSENGDIDLRFPFAPMANYVPATEIDASYGTYHFEKYEVKIVDVKRPDYSDIRRNFRQIDQNTQDPRVKKLCGDQSKASQAIITLPSDPRKRKNQDEIPPTPKKLQISSILQNSKHYNELSSSQKMVVNDVLSELSKQLKLFHSDLTPTKIFDTTIISTNPRLQQILIGLGVFVNAEGEFEEIKDFSIQSSNVPSQNVSLPTNIQLPNIHQMPPSILPPSLLQPPPNLMLQPPPNFLPASTSNMPPFFDPQEVFSSMSSQPPSFNNEQTNYNRNQRQQQSSNNFRNNSNRNNNNNNYRGGNRR